MILLGARYVQQEIPAPGERLKIRAEKALVVGSAALSKHDRRKHEVGGDVGKVLGVAGTAQIAFARNNRENETSLLAVARHGKVVIEEVVVVVLADVRPVVAHALWNLPPMHVALAAGRHEVEVERLHLAHAVATKRAVDYGGNNARPEISLYAHDADAQSVRDAVDRRRLHAGAA